MSILTFLITLLESFNRKKINKVYFFNHENLSKKIIIDNIDSSCINKKKINYLLYLRCFVLINFSNSKNLSECYFYNDDKKTKNHY